MAEEFYENIPTHTSIIFSVLSFVQIFLTEFFSDVVFTVATGIYKNWCAHNVMVSARSSEFEIWRQTEKRKFEIDYDETRGFLTDR